MCDCVLVHFLSVSPGPSHLDFLFDLLDDLTQWKILGLKLGLSFPTLEKIECDKQGVDNRKMAMLHMWLEKGGATRRSLVSALSRMGENRLADRVLTIGMTVTYNESSSS